MTKEKGRVLTLENAPEDVVRDIRTIDLQHYMLDTPHWALWEGKHLQRRMDEGINVELSGSGGMNFKSICGYPARLMLELKMEDMTSGHAPQGTDAIDVYMPIINNRKVYAAFYRAHIQSAIFRKAAARGTLQKRKIRRRPPRP
ncbi:MAG: hypothetical protein OXT65_05965 [Alphaproteobacteria bacterium]|nr:hypothetical protein [Alphaproteobacteria bacterium]